MFLNKVHSEPILKLTQSLLVHLFLSLIGHLIVIIQFLFSSKTSVRQIILGLKSLLLHSKSKILLYTVTIGIK